MLCPDRSRGFEPQPRRATAIPFAALCPLCITEIHGLLVPGTVVRSPTPTLYGDRLLIGKD